MKFNHHNLFIVMKKSIPYLANVMLVEKHVSFTNKTVFETGNSHNSEYELREEVSKITNKLQL